VNLSNTNSVQGPHDPVPVQTLDAKLLVRIHAIRAPTCGVRTTAAIIKLIEPILQPGGWAWTSVPTMASVEDQAETL
jgi:hypothetical protein